MEIDTTVLGGEPAEPATGRVDNRTTVSYFFDRPTGLSFVDICRSACKVPLSVWAQPAELPMSEISQASSPSLSLGDATFSLLLPPFPPAPPYFFGRESTLGDLLNLAERSASVTLVGAAGMGKTAIALKLLHHHQILIRFGRRRYFVLCHNLDNSLDGFLARLSETMGAPEATDTAQLLSHLESSPPCILVLDGIDSILDPLTPGAAEISKTIAELGRCPKVYVVATSRMDPKFPSFRRREVSAFLEEAARNVFHSSCRLERSAVIDTILAELDFHPLSIVLLASAVSENEWDEPALSEAWKYGKTCTLKASGRESLEDNIKSILRTPTIQELGITARETLEAIANVQGGVKEIYLLTSFPEINGVGEAVDALCKFSLMYRQDGFVGMLAPFRLYFQYTWHVANSGLSLSSRLLLWHRMSFL